MARKNSKRANRYGTLAERKMADRWNLRRDGVHTFWRDAIDADGTAWELKATAAQVASDGGRPGRFRIREHAHDRLLDAGGWYGFAVYVRAGSRIRVLDYRALPAVRLPVSAWYGNGDGEHTKIAIADLFE